MNDILFYLNHIEKDSIPDNGNIFENQYIFWTFFLYYYKRMILYLLKLKYIENITIWRKTIFSRYELILKSIRYLFFVIKKKGSKIWWKISKYEFCTAKSIIIIAWLFNNRIHCITISLQPCGNKVTTEMLTGYFITYW